MCASGGEKADEPRHSHSHTHTHKARRRSILGVVWREAHRVTEEEVGSWPRKEKGKKETGKKREEKREKTK